MQVNTYRNIWWSTLVGSAEEFGFFLCTKFLMKNLKIVKNQTEFPLSMYLFYFLTFYSVYSVLHLHKLCLVPCCCCMWISSQNFLVDSSSFATISEIFRSEFYFSSWWPSVNSPKFKHLPFLSVCVCFVFQRRIRRLRLTLYPGENGNKEPKTEKSDTVSFASPSVLPPPCYSGQNRLQIHTVQYVKLH